jgi:hypothetical protein
MPCKKRDGSAAAAPPAAKAARAGSRGSRVLVEGAERVLLPTQPTAEYTAAGLLLPGGLMNACWAPPVVAIASFYRIVELPLLSRSSRAWPAGAGGGEITVHSVLGLRPGDDGEEACEVFEDITGWWLPESTWGNDEAFIKSASTVSNETVAVHREDGLPNREDGLPQSEEQEEEGKEEEEGECVNWGGPTSTCDQGVCGVADLWWSALTETLSGGDLVLLLLERLEGAKDKGNTHYLLVLGFEEETRRRRIVRKLWLKDPVEGDLLLEAELWAEPEVELLTKNGGGRTLDKYVILEATHLKYPVDVLAPLLSPPADSAAAADPSDAYCSGNPISLPHVAAAATD